MSRIPYYSLKEQLARWMLMYQDRVDRDGFPIIREFLLWQFSVSVEPILDDPPTMTAIDGLPRGCIRRSHLD